MVVAEEVETGPGQATQPCARAQGATVVTRLREVPPAGSPRRPLVLRDARPVFWEYPSRVARA